MKRIIDITYEDILKFSNWEARRDENDVEYAVPDIKTNDLDQGWYLTRTEYTLADGTRYLGFVIDLYQRSGYVLFIDEKQVTISDWEYVEDEGANKLSSLLNKPVNSIFPIRFKCELTHWGNKVEGRVFI